MRIAWKLVMDVTHHEEGLPDEIERKELVFIAVDLEELADQVRSFKSRTKTVTEVLIYTVERIGEVY